MLGNNSPERGTEFDLKYESPHLIGEMQEALVYRQIFFNFHSILSPILTPTPRVGLLVAQRESLKSLIVFRNASHGLRGISPPR